MNLIECAHSGYIEKRRVRSLAGHLSAILPKNVSVLDVGCGSGQLARSINQGRTDLAFTGIDVLLREKTWMPVRTFDGRTIPFESASMDVVMFVDVLHHTNDPITLMREAARVARKSVIIKDHLLEGILAESTLRFMDHIGNARYGVALPGNYMRRRDWEQVFRTIGMIPVEWREQLGLYPPILDLFFGRSLHFVARFDVRQAT
ncbi:MAG TPA: class I SAM-dependent methyltransferase [Nitrospira sp.]|nr:class I SAM-dependent methyltransferase [Nitrospira sp.]